MLLLHPQRFMSFLHPAAHESREGRHRTEAGSTGLDPFQDDGPSGANGRLSMRNRVTAP